MSSDDYRNAFQNSLVRIFEQYITENKRLSPVKSEDLLLL